jgi:hypothetical protein
METRKMIGRFAAISLLVVACTIAHPAEKPETDDECRDAARRVDELGCVSQWGIDEGDGSFFDLCVRERKNICARSIATAASCEEIDSASSPCEE